MRFTLGMPFLAVLGKFYRNVKGLNQYYFALYYLLLILFVLNTLTDYNAFLINFRNFAFIKIG